MNAYLIILLIYINSTLSHTKSSISNGVDSTTIKKLESRVTPKISDKRNLLSKGPILVFHDLSKGMFSLQFAKTTTKLNEREQVFLTETDKIKFNYSGYTFDYNFGKIDYSLNANLIVWRDLRVLYAIPMDERY
jgi:hypothetical protein